MRWLLILILLLLTISLTSCSYLTDFVVVNDADYAIEVVYTVKPVPHGPPSLEIEPMVVSSDKLELRDKSKLRKLTSDQFRVDQENRTVVVRLSAHEALLITSMPHYIGDEDPNDVENFPIQEISVADADGEIKFTGDKARKAFERRSRVLYVLSYR
jgi:hypothetical protein